MPKCSILNTDVTSSVCLIKMDLHSLFLMPSEKKMNPEGLSPSKLSTKLNTSQQ